MPNDSIAKAFAPCGEVVDIKIVRDREDPSKSKGYGFVTFSNGDGAFCRRYYARVHA